MKKLVAILILIAFAVFVLAGLVFSLKGELVTLDAGSSVWFHIHIVSLICFGCVAIFVGTFVLSKIVIYTVEGIEELFNKK